MTNSSVSPLISVATLAERLQQGDESILVVDCRFKLSDPDWGFQQYQLGHIPGAIYLNLDRDLSSPVQTHGGRHPLPDVADLAETFGKAGITSQHTWVVAYDDSRFAFASRLWWLLRYLGHDRVSLLDGGWPAWQLSQTSISQEIPQYSQGKFSPQPRSPWIVEKEAVQQQKDLVGTLLVDSRERDRYDGLREPIDPIAGHIPGAICLPWQEVTNAQGYALPPETLRQPWEELGEPEEIIVYCGSGVTACVNLLAREIAGLPTAKLYPGGWSDWCSYPLESP